MKALKVENLKKIYGSKGKGVTYTALDNVSFEVDEGEFLGVMGPSGAGKTTLLNIISTIDTPTYGNVIVGDENISKLNDKQLSVFRRERLGFIFQDFNLLDNLTIKENIILPLTLSRVSVPEIEKKLKIVALDLGITDILPKRPYEVSGGQKQRTAAARAIISSPKLILADEPTGALDSKSSKELLEALSSLNEKNKATIMVVTHDAFAASYCKRIIFIKDGRLFTELVRGESRKAFFHKILDVLAALGGDNNDLA